MGDNQIVGDRRDVHFVEGSGCTREDYRRGRWRRVGKGVTHQRLLNRHVGTRTAGNDSDTTARGHSASIAATIAATSSSVAEGETWTFIASRPARSASDR
jgi:hypothetical protein